MFRLRNYSGCISNYRALSQLVYLVRRHFSKKTDANMKFLYNTIFIILLGLLFSCSNEEIFIPKPCTEEPSLSSNTASIILNTDTSIYRTFEVSNTGIFYCDSLIIKKAGITKNAYIYGALCKNNTAEIDIVYRDTLDNSRLKISARQYSDNNFGGEILYGQNGSNFIQIGVIAGIVGYGFEGSFNSPIFYGSFTVYVASKFE